MTFPDLPASLLRATVAAASLAAAVAARADDGSPPPRQEAAPAEDAPAGDGPEGDTWLDAGHEMVEDVIGTVLRLDRFFSDERELDPVREKSFVRWRNDVHVTQDDKFQYVSTLRANLRFPGLSQKLRDRIRLVIEGESDDAPEVLFPSTGPGVSPAAPPKVIEDAAAELRYGLVRGVGLDVDAGAGIMLRLPVGAIGRVRVRYARPIGKTLLARAAWTGFWRTDLRLGSSADVDVQRTLGPLALVRLATNVHVNQEEIARGFQWGSELALMRAIGPRHAVSIGAGVGGVTRPDLRVEAYRTYLRYRRDLLRRWFYVELEPEATWPVEPGVATRTVLGFIVRAEVQFHGNGVSARSGDAVGAKGEPEPADPEPRDPD